MLLLNVCGTTIAHAEAGADAIPGGETSELKLSNSVPDRATHGSVAKHNTASSLFCFFIVPLLGCLVWLGRGPAFHS